MKKTILIFALCLLPALAWSEVITLKSGKIVSGQILIQNDDVLIIRDANGARFQYPMADVLSVSKEANKAVETVVETAVETSEGSKKATLSLEVSGGGLYVGKGQTGGYAAADLVIGTRQLMGQPILLGGSIGYLGTFSSGSSYNFLPICLAMRVPLTDGKHAPMIGASIGYGIGLSKNYLGGIHAGMDVAYRYAINSRSALTIGLNVRFQQATMNVSDAITYPIVAESKETILYSHSAGRNMVAFGLKLGLLF